MKNNKLVKNSLRFNKILISLLSSSSFLTITFFGNLMIVSICIAFYFAEVNVNSNVQTVSDAIWWGFATATTVGYGDIIPVTTEGRVLGIFLMLSGTALFATYAALFAQTFLEDEILQIHDLSKDSEENDFIEQLRGHKKLIEKQISFLKVNKK